MTEGEQIMLETFWQRRKAEDVWEYKTPSGWVSYEALEASLLALGCTIGSIFGDVPLKDVPADVQAQIEGELRKAFPGKRVIWPGEDEVEYP